jgi:hypothetical protein
VPVVCVDEDGDDPCTVATCDPASGRCLRHPLDCDDGVPETIDSCVAGKCVNERVHCENIDPCFVNRTSHIDGRCHAHAKDCSDGNPCTRDTCVRGECVHVPRRCHADDKCVTSHCDRWTGECVDEPIDCRGTDPCMEFSCNSTVGCVVSPKDCNDHVRRPCVCVCVCSRGANEVSQDPCTVDSCDTETGRCIRQPRPDIDDGDRCTHDMCIDGVVTHTRADCTDPDPCVVGSCNPATGSCVRVRRSACSACPGSTCEACPLGAGNATGCVPTEDGLRRYRCAAAHVHEQADHHDGHGHGDDRHRTPDAADREHEHDHDCVERMCDLRAGAWTTHHVQDGRPCHDRGTCKSGRCVRHDGDDHHDHDGHHFHARWVVIFLIACVLVAVCVILCIGNYVADRERRDEDEDE